MKTFTGALALGVAFTLATAPALAQGPSSSSGDSHL